LHNQGGKINPTHHKEEKR